MVLQGGEEAIRQCVPNRYSMIQFKHVQKVKMLYSASQIFTMLYRLMFEKSLAVLTDLGTRATIAKLLGKAIKHNYGVHTMEHLEGIRTIWKQIKYDKIVWNRCGWLLQSRVSTVANQVQIKWIDSEIDSSISWKSLMDSLNWDFFHNVNARAWNTAIARQKFYWLSQDFPSTKHI